MGLFHTEFDWTFASSSMQRRRHLLLGVFLKECSMTKSFEAHDSPCEGLLRIIDINGGDTNNNNDSQSVPMRPENRCQGSRFVPFRYVAATVGQRERSGPCKNNFLILFLSTLLACASGAAPRHVLFRPKSNERGWPEVRHTHTMWTRANTSCGTPLLALEINYVLIGIATKYAAWVIVDSDRP